MTAPVFSNHDEPLLIRTSENMTCGITNIPLTKPAKINFLHDIENEERIIDTYKLYESLGIEFTRTDTALGTKVLFQAKNESNYKTVKLVWKNFKTLHPKFESQYRYMFWEIDYTSKELLNEVMSIFVTNGIPVYVHRTMRGYHFLSVVPINVNQFNSFAKMLRPTNSKYPPITLRINPNKYRGEAEVFRDHFFYFPKEHYDTRKLHEMIQAHDYIKLGEQYQLVWYPIDKKLTKEDYTP